MTSKDIVRLDRLWSAAIKELHGENCLWCGSGFGVQAAHIAGRRHLSIRWDLRNGLPLCAYHHSAYDAKKGIMVSFVRAFVGEETWAMLQAAKRTTTRDNGERLCYEEAVMRLYQQAEEMKGERDGN